MQETLSNYLSEELLNELEISAEPIGTASMGQVHLAIVKSTGQKIALKIQYPDLESAIDSDVKALKTLLQFSQLIPSELKLDPVFEEIKIMLHQELDYKKEADWTKLYYEKITS